ncbi:MAG: HAMP domain-containing histidine kinase, partial [Gemmatimonadota bacterium]|nr:HAMP domain-containing histidine kinase [Gemmatimonadota bacterium]
RGVLLDPGQFRMVVTNLVHNACEASAGVGGTVSVVLRTRAPESGWDDAPGLAELTVRDTGTGMDEDTRAHIFDPFFTTKDTGKGVGLGMAGVYGAVTRSQGSIEVRSERGEGTVIEVRWPLCGECLDRRSGTS